jgi:hypothetical protein
LPLPTDTLIPEASSPKTYATDSEDGLNHWLPLQKLPFEEIVLFAYAVDRSSRPTYVSLLSGLHHARNGRILERAGPYQEVTPLPGILFFDAWRVEPTLDIPSNLPSAQDAPEEGTGPSYVPKG